MAQIGDAEDEDKKFASLRNRTKYRKHYFRRSAEFIFITKNLGTYKGEEVEVSNGRFGPYVRHGTVLFLCQEVKTHWMFLWYVRKN